MRWLAQARILLTTWRQGASLGRRGEQAAEENLKIPGLGLNPALKAMGALERGLSPLLDRLPIPGASLFFALRRDD